MTGPAGESALDTNGPWQPVDLLQLPVPFRMQPGLSRLAPGGPPAISPLWPTERLYAERERVVSQRQAIHALPGTDPTPLLQTLRQYAGRQPLWAGSPAWDSVKAAADPNAWPLIVREDLVWLDGRPRADEQAGRLRWLCVCNPSHWAPEDKAGASLTDLHRPVADNALIQSAAQHLVRLVTAGESWERTVWTITPDGRYDQHPQRSSERQWPGSANLDEYAAQCFWRTERQVFLPFTCGDEPQQAVFCIRVDVNPLPSIVNTAAQAARLHDCLASMSAAVLSYRGLHSARHALLAWLQARAQRGD
jgi:hypothetical protein